MGCIKSKESHLSQNTSSVENLDDKTGRQQRGENVPLVHSELGPGEDSPLVDPVLLEYAQRLSEEIVACAVQQWVEVDHRYSDIPYIECDVA